MEMPHIKKHLVQKVGTEIFQYLFFTFTAVLIAFLLFTFNKLATENFVIINTEASPVSTRHTNPLQSSSQTQRAKIIGFLPYWNVNDELKLHNEYLDEIIYFGIGINQKGQLEKYDENNKPLVGWDTFNSSQFSEIQKQAQDTNTKVLIAIKNFDNTSIDTLISSPNYTKQAISQIVSLVEKYKLDGVNIDFEYFTQIDFPTFKYYSNFLTELNTSLKKQNSRSILSVDINASAVYKDNAYDIVKIGDVVDEVIIMGYDYHTLGSFIAGPVAPIEAKSDKDSLQKTITSLKGRVDPKKVILGLPLYGYEWQTTSREYGSATIPETGALASYKRVQELLASKDDIKVTYDKLSQSPRIVYLQNGLIKQIYFEDEQSLEKKFEFIHTHQLGGIGLWALGYEGGYIEPWELIKNLRSGL